MSGEILELYTEFEDVVELASGLMDRVEPGRLILYGPEGYEAGAAISYALYLADGSPGLAGSGVVAGSVDSGDERHESARFDIVIDQLVMDSEYESSFVTMLNQLGFAGEAVSDDRVFDTTSPDNGDDAASAQEPFAAQPFAAEDSAPFGAIEVDDSPLSPEGSDWATSQYALDDVLGGGDIPADELPAPGSVRPLSDAESEMSSAERNAEEIHRADDDGADVVAAESDSDAFSWSEEASPSARRALEASDRAPAVESERSPRSEPPSVSGSVPPARSGAPRAARGAAADAAPATTAGHLTRPILAEAWSLSAAPLEKLPQAGPFFDYPDGELPTEAAPPRPEGFQHVQLSPAPHPARMHSKGSEHATAEAGARSDVGSSADLEPLDWSEEESVSRAAFHDEIERVSDYPTPM